MDIEKFKKESKVTYVHVKGECRGVFHPGSYHGYSFEYKTNKLSYSGYIEVPFSYDEFISFNKCQQIAICEASLTKAGLAIMVRDCDENQFYNNNGQTESNS
jgi:hypothetical protein